MPIIAGASISELPAQLAQIFYTIMLPILLLAGIGWGIQRKLGLDMATLRRLNFYFIMPALVYGAQDDDQTWHIWADFFAPDVGLIERCKRDRVPYDVWAREGFITLTPGASVDLEIVAQRMIDLCDDHSILKIAYDRWRMDIMKKELTDLGAELPLIMFGQGFRDMSPAVDVFEAALFNEKLRHGNNPVLTMCAANVRAVQDPAGNRKLDKMRSTGRIDGIQALTMMMGVAAKPEGDADPPSVYEGRGVLEL